MSIKLWIKITNSCEKIVQILNTDGGDTQYLIKI